MNFHPRLGVAARLSATAKVFSLSLLLAGSAQAQSLLLDGQPDLTGWTTHGSATVWTTVESFDIEGNPFSIGPAAGHAMFRLEPSGSAVYGAAAGDVAMGLSVGTLNGLLETHLAGITNFSIITKTLSLSAGSYSFAWAMAANDYQPYNDGVLFAIAGASSQQVISLARNGAGEEDISGPSPGTLVLGSYGSTSWKTTVINVAEAGNYQVSFAAYNWDDDGYNPFLYVSAVPGSFSGTEVDYSSPIPEPSTYALIAGAAAMGLVWLRRRRQAQA